MLSTYLLVLALVILLQFLPVIMLIYRLVINLVILAYLLLEASYRGLRFIWQLIIPAIPGALRLVIVMANLPDYIIDFVYSITAPNTHGDMTADVAPSAHVNPPPSITSDIMQQCSGLRRDNERCGREKSWPANKIFYCWQHNA
jgi:hypothetical protein